MPLCLMCQCTPAHLGGQLTTLLFSTRDHPAIPGRPGGPHTGGAMNGNATQHVATVTLPAGLDVSLVSSPAPAPATPAITPATRQRKYTFSFREKELPVSLIERHGGVVESRTGDGVTIEQKVAAWADVQQRFNQMNGQAQERSVTELKKCYWNLKQKTKKALDAGREATAAGAGSTKIDRVLWRIAQLAPEQFEGLLDIHCEVVDAVPEFESKGETMSSLHPLRGGGRRARV